MTPAHLPLQAPPADWVKGVVHSAYLNIALGLPEFQHAPLPIRKPSGDRLVAFLDVVPLLDVLQAREHPERGIAVGALISAFAHGSMGYAAVTSATLAQALETIARYAPLRNRLFRYHFERTANECILRFIPNLPMHAYRSFCERVTAATVYKMVQSLAGEVAAAKLHCDITWQDDGALQVPMQLYHRQAITALRVPLALAEAANPTADAKQYAMACRSCEAELETLNGHIAARLRALMPDAQQHWPSLHDAADKLALSPRTLLRRLAAEGLSFQSVLDEAKSELACWYLTHTPLPMSGIAERLGLDDSNFSRSFRRWHGVTPLVYRKQHNADY